MGLVSIQLYRTAMGCDGITRETRVASKLWEISKQFGGLGVRCLHPCGVSLIVRLDRFRDRLHGAESRSVAAYRSSSCGSTGT